MAGLVVIDFIDMDDSKANAQVERKLKEALRKDRAKIQIGRISQFGLLEMSRQRLRPSLIEATSAICSACSGSGSVPSTEVAAMMAVRAIEEEAMRRRANNIDVEVPAKVGFYLLNNKRRSLANIEMNFEVNVNISVNDALVAPAYELIRDNIDNEDAKNKDAKNKDSKNTEKKFVKNIDNGKEEVSEDTRKGRNRRNRNRNKNREEGDTKVVAVDSKMINTDTKVVAVDSKVIDSDAVSTDNTSEKNEGKSENQNRRRRRRNRNRNRPREENKTGENNVADNTAPKLDDFDTVEKNNMNESEQKTIEKPSVNSARKEKANDTERVVIIEKSNVDSVASNNVDSVTSNNVDSVTSNVEKLVKKVRAKKSTAKKASTKKASTKKASAKKTSAKKTSAKKASAKKTIVNKAVVQKTPEIIIEELVEKTPKKTGWWSK